MEGNKNAYCFGDCMKKMVGGNKKNVYENGAYCGGNAPEISGKVSTRFFQGFGGGEGVRMINIVVLGGFDDCCKLGKISLLNTKLIPTKKIQRKTNKKEEMSIRI